MDRVEPAVVLLGGDQVGRQEAGQDRMDVVALAPVGGDDLADRPLPVDEREDPPFPGGQPDVVLRRLGGDEEWGVVVRQERCQVRRPFEAPKPLQQQVRNALSDGPGDARDEPVQEAEPSGPEGQRAVDGFLADQVAAKSVDDAPLLEVDRGLGAAARVLDQENAVVRLQVEELDQLGDGEVRQVAGSTDAIGFS